MALRTGGVLRTTIGRFNPNDQFAYTVDAQDPVLLRDPREPDLDQVLAKARTDMSVPNLLDREEYVMIDNKITRKAHGNLYERGFADPYEMIRDKINNSLAQGGDGSIQPSLGLSHATDGIGSVAFDVDALSPEVAVMNTIDIWSREGYSTVEMANYVKEKLQEASVMNPGPKKDADTKVALRLSGLLGTSELTQMLASAGARNKHALKIVPFKDVDGSTTVDTTQGPSSDPSTNVTAPGIDDAVSERMPIRAAPDDAFNPYDAIPGSATRALSFRTDSDNVSFRSALSEPPSSTTDTSTTMSMPGLINMSENSNVTSTNRNSLDMSETRANLSNAGIQVREGSAATPVQSINNSNIEAYTTNTPLASPMSAPDEGPSTPIADTSAESTTIISEIPKDISDQFIMGIAGNQIQYASPEPATEESAEKAKIPPTLYMFMVLFGNKNLRQMTIFANKYNDIPKNNMPGRIKFIRNNIKFGKKLTKEQGEDLENFLKDLDAATQDLNATINTTLRNVLQDLRSNTSADYKPFGSSTPSPISFSSTPSQKFGSGFTFSQAEERGKQRLRHEYNDVRTDPRWKEKIANILGMEESYVRVEDEPAQVSLEPTPPIIQGGGFSQDQATELGGNIFSAIAKAIFGASTKAAAKKAAGETAKVAAKEASKVAAKQAAKSGAKAALKQGLQRAAQSTAGQAAKRIAASQTGRIAGAAGKEVLKAAIGEGTQEAVRAADSAIGRKIKKTKQKKRQRKAKRRTRVYRDEDTDDEDNDMMDTDDDEDMPPPPPPPKKTKGKKGKKAKKQRTQKPVSRKRPSKDTPGSSDATSYAGQGRQEESTNVEYNARGDIISGAAGDDFEDAEARDTGEGNIVDEMDQDNQMEAEGLQPGIVEEPPSWTQPLIDSVTNMIKQALASLGTNQASELALEQMLTVSKRQAVVMHNAPNTQLKPGQASFYGSSPTVIRQYVANELLTGQHNDGTGSQAQKAFATASKALNRMKVTAIRSNVGVQQAIASGLNLVCNQPGSGIGYPAAALAKQPGTVIYGCNENGIFACFVRGGQVFHDAGAMVKWQRGKLSSMNFGQIVAQLAALFQNQPPANTVGQLPQTTRAKLLTTIKAPALIKTSVQCVAKSSGQSAQSVLMAPVNNKKTGIVFLTMLSTDGNTVLDLNEIHTPGDSAKATRNARVAAAAIALY